MYVYMYFDFLSGFIKENSITREYYILLFKKLHFYELIQ